MFQILHFQNNLKSFELIPFGEVFIDEHPSVGSWSTPYKFNAKELDEETGLYYYGARYYDPRSSVWISADALAEITMKSYSYCGNNPVNYIVLHEGLHDRYEFAKLEGKMSDYPTLNRQQQTGNSNFEHENMAEGNIGLLVNGMKEFDNINGYAHSEDWYNAMAWRGSLEDTSGHAKLDPKLQS